MNKILELSKTYARFFLRNRKSRYMILQGSRRSSKSWSVYKWIALLCHDKTPIKVYVTAATYPAVMLAVDDFQNATGLTVTGSAVNGFSCVLPTGSIVCFKAFDTPEKAQGTSCDILVVEEALNVPEQVVNVLSMSVRKQIIFIYNPTKKAYTDKYIAADGSNYLKTTFKDNPHLTPEQVQEFEFIKEQALKPTASILDKYNYKVYYLGDFSDMAGKVFMELFSCSDDEYSKIPTYETLGLDFGFVDSRDKTTLVGAKVHNNCLYLKEYFSSTHLTDNKDLAFKLAECGVDCYSYICGDYGGLGKERMKQLCSAGGYSWTEETIRRGFNIVNATKGKITEGLSTMLQFDKIIVTSSSTTLRAEMENYELNADGKEVSKHEDCVSAARYATTMQSRILV